MKLRLLFSCLPGAFFILASSATVNAQSSNITIGQSTGANIKFSSSVNRSYNFGITSEGGSSSLSLSSVNLFLQAENGGTSQDIDVAIYGGFGGTGLLLASGKAPGASLSGQFDPYVVALGTTLNLTSGAYSLVITTSSTTDYGFKGGALFLNTGGATLTSGLWVQDSNDNGTASTSIVPEAGYILADKGISTSSVNFGNYRVGSTLNQSVTLSNTAFQTTTNVTEGLTATSSLTG